MMAEDKQYQKPSVKSVWHNFRILGDGTVAVVTGEGSLEGDLVDVNDEGIFGNNQSIWWLLISTKSSFNVIASLLSELVSLSLPAFSSSVVRRLC